MLVASVPYLPHIVAAVCRAEHCLAFGARHCGTQASAETLCRFSVPRRPAKGGMDSLLLR